MASQFQFDLDHALKLMKAGREEAGREYFERMVELGFVPDIVCWVYSELQRDVSLVMVTSMVDAVGPNTIYDTLFLAYDASILPRSVSPFSISLYSPQMRLAVELKKALKINKDGTFDLDGGAKPVDEAIFVIKQDGETSAAFGFGLYRAAQFQYDPIRDRRLWDRFNKAVARAAA